MIFFSKLKSQQLTTSLKIVWDFCQVKFSRNTTIQIVEYIDLQTLFFQILESSNSRISTDTKLWDFAHLRVCFRSIQVFL